jgi:hypothetical protein
VLLLGRDFGFHKGLGVNGSHTAAVLRRAGVRAQDMLFTQERLFERMFEAIEKTRPRAVVLMAFFLDPQAIANIAEAFPRTRIYVKCHSNPQFLAGENHGWQRLLQIADLGAGLPNLGIGCASEDMTRTLQALGVKAVWLPNVYDLAAAGHARGVRKFNDGALHVGIFGALRPFKNAVGQTCALAMAARASARPLVLHTNGTRVEMAVNNDLVNMREICRRSGFRLEVHGWLDYAEFISLAARMHVALQVSFTETFNYVAADCIAAGTPVVGSPAIRFLPDAWKVNPDDTAAMAAAILDAPGWEVGEGRRALETWNQRVVCRLLEELTNGSLCRGGKLEVRRLAVGTASPPSPPAPEVPSAAKTTRKSRSGSSKRTTTRPARVRAAAASADGVAVASSLSSDEDETYHL